MARRRGKKGRHGKVAIPLVEGAIIAFPIIGAFQSQGFTLSAADKAIYDLTGYSTGQKGFIGTSYWNGIKTGATLLILGTVGNKIANKTGANRLVKKLSMGYLKLL